MRDMKRYDEATKWARRVDSETLAAMLTSGLPLNHPDMMAALDEWRRRNNA